MRNTASEVSKIYQSIDAQISEFQKVTGLGCREGCGNCCRSPEVQATVLELLPLAQAIYESGRVDEVLDKLDTLESHICVFFDSQSEWRGRCTIYDTWPLLCRQFGFAAQRRKGNELVLSTCSVIKTLFPDVAARAEAVIAEHGTIENGALPPIWGDAMMSLYVLSPDLARERHPINRAIRLAVEKWGLVEMLGGSAL